ncbi:MAG: iron(III) transport system permease protein [Pseudonocardiales bacterium]|jgi:iron(III) transport system permease protein|nr:transporter permease [Pseudonocardia sp.]MDT7652269.1 iron(III) transport system permease protein [Pseudonocardiales bacterium]
MTQLLDAPPAGSPSPSVQAKRTRRPTLLYLLGAVTVALLAYLVLSPLVYLTWRGLTTGEGLSLANIASAYSVSGTPEMLFNSFVFAIGSAAVSTISGTALAFFCVRSNAPFKPLLYAASIVPLIVPGILFTIAWVFLLSKDVGVINVALRGIGLDWLQVDAFSLPGMILIDGMHLSPLVFLLMFAAFRATDPALEESALMSGATVPQTIRRITLPLVRPALLGAILIMVVRGLESFETPAVLGIPSGNWVFTSRIYEALHTYPIRYDVASIYSLSLLLLTVLGLLLVQRANSRGERFQTISGKGFRPRPLDLGAWRWPVSVVFAVYFVVVVVLPVAILLWMSLLPFYQAPSASALKSVSFANYGRILETSSILTSVSNSAILAVVSATAVMLFMSVVAWLVLKSRLPGRRILETLASFPLAMPGLVLGVALIFIYLRSPLPIYGTLVILFIAYVTRYLPYGIRYASSSLSQVSTELEDSARMSGATWWDTFRRVVLPLMGPGIVAGWVYIVVVSVRELSSSILLYSQGTRVLSVTIWELWENGETGVLAAVGVVMVVVLMLLVGAAYRLGAKIGVREF